MIHQCINCETVWEDDSTELKAVCSDKCEKEYEEHLKAVEKWSKADPNCEMCQGTGTVSMDDTMEGYSFHDFTCECVKEG